MLKFCRVLTVLCVGALPCVALAQPALPNLVSQIQRSVVTIFSTDQIQGESSQGSGFFVEPNLVVTNSHVVQGARKLIVRTHDGKQFTVESVPANDSKHDLAILKIWGAGQPLRIAADLPSR